jgi:2-oxoisovalerate dehydrogenase E1 component
LRAGNAFPFSTRLARHQQQDSIMLANASKPIKSADADFARAAYRQMLFIRGFEQRCLDLSTATPPGIAGSIHLCAGQEAIPVGAMAALRPGEDSVVSTYRGHGWALTGTLDAEQVFAEVCHRKTGINGGRAGSALITAPWDGFIGENSIVGAGGPIACGVAMAAKLKGSGEVTLVSFGDGATSQGALHESFVFAAAYGLPVIFLCENNAWSEMTESSEIIKVDRLAKRAGGYGMSGVTIDGTDPIAVRDTIAQAADQARAGRGPSFIECKVSRLWGHYNRDIEHYRSKEDRASAVDHDPLTLLATRMLESGIETEPDLATIRAAVEQELAAIAKTVAQAPHPDAADARKHVTAATQPRASKAAKPVAAAETTYINAVNEALRRILADNDRALVYGEDIGKAGGIFGAARNLQREFGADRVFDTPIAEAAILGSAIGAALEGFRPVVEIMWADFMLVALDQLINQAANIRYVTQGRAHLPMVVRTQQGATPGSCSQHSQSLEALLFHIPGLLLGMPSTPQDAYDMLRAAAAAEDPTILIEARGLYQRKGEVVFDRVPDPIGTARLARAGSDVAIIAWGTAAVEAVDAAERLAKDGIDAAVLDLRWLAPLDETAIDDVVRKAKGRVLIAHEANRTGGVGAEIAARIAETHRDAVIRRLGAPDTRIPAAPVLQAALLPKADAITAAARELVQKQS